MWIKVQHKWDFYKLLKNPLITSFCLEPFREFFFRGLFPRVFPTLSVFFRFGLLARIDHFIRATFWDSKGHHLLNLVKGFNVMKEFGDSRIAPKSENQVAVTSYWHECVRSGHNIDLLNNGVDTNNSWSSFISLLLWDAYRIFWGVNTCILLVCFFLKLHVKNCYKHINISEIRYNVYRTATISYFDGALFFAISVTLLKCVLFCSNN